MSRDFAQEPPSSWLRRVLLFQKIYFPLLVLRDPLWPRGTVGWGDLCQGCYEPLTREGQSSLICVCQTVAPGDIKHHGYRPLSGVVTFFPGSPLQPSCWQPGVFDEAKACEPKLDLGTWSLQQRASRKRQEASTIKLYRWRSHLEYLPTELHAVQFENILEDVKDLQRLSTEADESNMPGTRRQTTPSYIWLVSVIFNEKNRNQYQNFTVKY